jgi:molybdopterin molybdotransferase
MSSRVSVMSVPPRNRVAALESVRRYQASIAAVIAALPPRTIDLDDADGTVLAEDISAAHPLPLFRNSAMDGYAVAARDLAGAAAATPVLLPVTGEIAAGDTRRPRLVPGTCVKIMTGARVPDGADAVVRREQVSETGGKAAFTRPSAPGDSVRPAGGEARPGDLLLPAGTPLGPAQLGLLAAAGRPSVLARPRPRVTVLSAGDELRSPGTPTLPGQAWESNSFMLAAAARRLGCAVRRGPVIRDEPAAVRAALRDAATGTDLIVTSGGISMGGEHDAFKAALSGLGTVWFRRVAMRPGSPQGYGAIGDPPVPILLLPGNPVSAFVSFTLFAEPAVRVLRGRPTPPAAARAVLTGPLPSGAGKTCFVTGVRDRAAGTVTPAGTSAHALTGLARADCLIVVSPDGPGPGRGDSVAVLEIGP